MKIAFVSLMRSANWGGSEELWSKTALLALKQGHEVSALVSFWHPLSPRILELKRAGVNIQFYHKDSQALLDRVRVRLGLRRGRSFDVPQVQGDVYIISNGSTLDFTYNRSVVDMVVAANKPFLLINHNSMDYGSNMIGPQREYAISVINRANELLFVSERNREGAQRQLAYPIKQYRIVENPVSIHKADIKPYPVSDTLLMASVGSLDCGIKGQDLLLEALSGEVWKSRSFMLRIYGRGPHAEYLKQLIELYGLQGKVPLEGHVGNVDQIWETNQVLVLSSVTEGVPMVVIEAMLSGRAVLGTDVGAVDQYVEENSTGFLVAVAKAKTLAAGLEKLWNARSTLQQMGENAYQRANALYNPAPEASFLEIIEGHA